MNGSLKLTPITTLTKRMAIVKNGQTFDCRSYCIYSHETPWLKPAYMQIQACGTRKDKEPYMIIIY